MPRRNRRKMTKTGNPYAPIMFGSSVVFVPKGTKNKGTESGKPRIMNVDNFKSKLFSIRSK